MPSLGLPRRCGDHWLWIGGPVPPRADALTLGSLVIVRRGAAQSPGFGELMRHEHVHVQQWREFGACRFFSAYIGPYLRWRLRGHSHLSAYRRIPLEVRARHGARCVSAHTDAPLWSTGSMERSLPPASR